MVATYWWPGVAAATRNEIPTTPVIFCAMAVTVRIPTTLRPMSGGNKLVEVEPGRLSEVIAGLESAHPGFADRLLDDDGSLRKFVNVFVDDAQSWIDRADQIKRDFEGVLTKALERQDWGPLLAHFTGNGGLWRRGATRVMRSGAGAKRTAKRGSSRVMYRHWATARPKAVHTSPLPRR